MTISLELLNEGLVLLDKGGPVMYVLSAASVVAVAIILVKLYQFLQSDLRNERFIDQALDALSRGHIEPARENLTTTRNPIATVMTAAIDVGGNPALSAEEREKRVNRAGAQQMRNLESHLPGLELIGNLSPLLGLLGTVFGMINAFAQLEAAGSKVNPSLLAGGIWEALLTTAFGLTVAIPALAGFYLLDTRVDRVRLTMEEAVSGVLEAMEDSRIEPESEPGPMEAEGLGMPATAEAEA